MSAPKRIQRKREKGWRKPPGVVNIARPGKWGNDFKVCRVRGYLSKWEVVHIPSGDTSPQRFDDKREAAEYAVEMFEKHQLPDMDCEPLRGKDIMCFCPLDMPCHGDKILEKANR